MCMLADVYQGWTWENAGCSRMEPLELNDAGKARKDGISGRESQREKKLFR